MMHVDMSKFYNAIRVVNDGSIYVVQRRYDGAWRPCGWYSDKPKAVLAANSLAYCYNCEVVSITSM